MGGQQYQLLIQGSLLTSPNLGAKIEVGQNEDLSKSKQGHLQELGILIGAKLSKLNFPSLHYGDHQPTGGPLEYEKLNWVILEFGKFSADQNSQLLKMALFTLRDITGNVLSALMRKIATTMKNPIDDVPLLFIAPRFGTLRGTLVSAADTAVHPCFAARVMYTFFTEAIPKPSHDPTCLFSCPSQSDDLSDSDDDSLSMSISEQITHQNPDNHKWGTPSSSSVPLTVLTRPTVVTCTFGSRPTSVCHETSSCVSSFTMCAPSTMRPSLSEGSSILPNSAPCANTSAVTIDLTGNDTPVFTLIMDWANYVQAHGPIETPTIIPWRIGFATGNDGSDMNLSSLFMANCTFKVYVSKFSYCLLCLLVLPVGKELVWVWNVQ
ncbi:hypothetical protein C8R48DRAFT_680541 [Suillus tomentosus]|nr:hypothetical protein C8R48DRAFT_680541 [Suillus tomentosus]